VPERSKRDEAEAARYKQATNDALQQLDFCIGFFAATNKGKVATQLARNRAYIRTRMLGEDEQPLPTQNA
jgi:hypothetical protein